MTDLAPDTNHHIDLFVDQYGLRAKFRCTGDNTATCHRYPDCDCEDGWDPTLGGVDEEGDAEGAPCEHPQFPHESCWMSDWFESVEAYELYDGPKEQLLSTVPIEAHFDGDSLVWQVRS